VSTRASPPLPFLSSNEPILHCHHPYSSRSILMLSSHVPIGLPGGLFCCVVRIFHLSRARYMLRPSNSPHSYLMKSTIYDALHCVTFSILELLPPSYSRIFLPPSSHSSSICVLPLGWETRFYIHTKEHVITYFNFYVLR
jgi:hypothetical protein